MATRPGRIADASRKRGLAGIATRAHVTSGGMTLTGQIDRHDGNHSAVFRYVPYIGSPVDSGDFYEISADVSILVGRPVALLADALPRIAREVETTSDSRLVIARPALRYADTVLVIRRTTGYAGPTAQRDDRVLEFLGKGLRFPFTFQRRSGGAQISTATSSDHAHIHESIRQILGTRKGERFMRPEFGTRLYELVFEPNDRLLYGLIRHEVMEALDEWEPRVVVTDVIVAASDTDEHLVLVDIRYRLISAQVSGNLVWPFWRELE